MAEDLRCNIVQGEYKVSGEANVVITTLLGSCVAACLHDPIAGVGGMNHFLLPGQIGPQSERVGTHLMELLVNGLLKIGAARGRLQGKLFGGAKSFAGLSDIGAANGRFAQDFLKREGIPVTAVSLGGDKGRRIQYWPASGRVRQLFMASSFEEKPALVRLPQGGELELF